MVEFFNILTLFAYAIATDNILSAVYQNAVFWEQLTNIERPIHADLRLKSDSSKKNFTEIWFDFDLEKISNIAITMIYVVKIV